MNEQEGQTMKLGIYGGTFNPPHLGHLTSARLALDALGLDALQFVPAATPPHKALPAGSPAPEERLAMVELAAGGLLGNFIGMLTDSRSLLSYARHEYFRRVLCALLGRWVENGEYPNDLETVGGLVADICYRNAKRYFNL